MILPIVAYGHPILRKVGTNIDVEKDKEALKPLIENMWETMYHSNGVGLAAPQINKSLRLFVVDTVQIVEGFDDEDKEIYPNEKPIKSVFINAHVKEMNGEEWAYNEGCLSIPKVREDVWRQASITLSYLDENFQPQEKTFDGITARVIMHEYDHIDGKLFIDYLAPIKKRLLKKKLDDISKGKVSMGYRMIYPNKK
ncbi:MAG TPA: peptide deformylase [Edaphocola sp.]|nr:peptide deformylase [Edaphocola sp.]